MGAVIERQDVQALSIVRQLLPWRDQLIGGFGTGHGNADLQLIDGLLVLLAAFFNPMVRSQRLIEALSSQQWMQQFSDVRRIPKSTLSDAMARFDPEQLRPLIKQLAARVPALGRRDADLQHITRQIIAADGSIFQTAGDVAWAMLSAQKAKATSGNRRNQVRLNLQLAVDSFTPLDCDLSGDKDRSEPAAFIRRLHPDVIYVADRGFFSYAFINAVLATGSNLVVRIRKQTILADLQPLPLSARDVQAEVISDELGRFRGAAGAANAGHRSFTDKPPTQLLRRVIVRDEKNDTTMVLITDLLDLPAYVIAAIYRQRWQIELFFKWLKSYAAFDHLMSHHPNGVTLQFYIGVIATLLLHLSTGRKVNKYALFWLNSVACGAATFQQMQEGLGRIEREKELERARKRKKTAIQKLSQ